MGLTYSTGLHTDHAGWSAPSTNARPFDVDRWLAPLANDFDDEAIGLLTVPHPTLVISDKKNINYTCGSADLDDDEHAVAEGRPQDRNLVLASLVELPGTRLSGLAR